MKTNCIILVLFILFFSANCGSGMYFGRSQTCIENGTNGCKKWDIKVNLNYYYDGVYYMCFPQSTRVLTHDGQKSLK